MLGPLAPIGPDLVREVHKMFASFRIFGGRPTGNNLDQLASRRSGGGAEAFDLCFVADAGTLTALRGIAYVSNSLRNFSNSWRRASVVSGYDILSSSRVSRMICDTINRAFCLSSAGTTYHGESRVLVALRHSS